MIIALSGKIKSGKSTVANIIQLLIANKKLSDENPKDSFVYLLKPELLNIYEIKELNVISGWKQVAFAAKLKQIVALLIGCTVQDLEDQEFKSSPLGKVWERWYYSFYKMKTMTLGQFKDKIEELEKAGLITDDYELEVGTNHGYEPVTYIEVNNTLINNQTIRINID